MDEQKAVDVLIQVAELAQSRGVLSLDDAVLVRQAITVLTPKEEQAVEVEEA